MTRSILRIRGDDRLHFLQALVTQDVARLADEKIQFAALLSPQGKILHDMFLLDAGDAILLDTASQYKDLLMKRLAMYKLRAKVTIEDVSAQWQVALDDASGLPDPRHPDLPSRAYRPSSNHSPLTIHHSPLSLGIPELGTDFEPDSIVAMDAGYDLLHAISFTKGCYVGQEITARMHYKNIARRGFYILENEQGVPQKLALLKFEEVEAAQGRVTVDNVACTARLPGWMQPKLAQFKTGPNNQ